MRRRLTVDLKFDFKPKSSVKGSLCHLIDDRYDDIRSFIKLSSMDGWWFCGYTSSPACISSQEKTPNSSSRNLRLYKPTLHGAIESVGDPGRRTGASFSSRQGCRLDKDIEMTTPTTQTSILPMLKGRKRRICRRMNDERRLKYVAAETCSDMN